MNSRTIIINSKSDGFILSLKKEMYEIRNKNSTTIFENKKTEESCIVPFDSDDKKSKQRAIRDLVMKIATILEEE